MVSRREFLGHTVAATAAMVLPIDLRRVRETACVVLDVGEHCSVPESLRGYTGQFVRSFAFVRAEPSAPLGTAGQLIVPGVNHIDSSTAALVLTCLQHGGTVLLESGAAFGDFREHRDRLREYFDVDVEPPVELWPARGVPYVDYTWPVSTKVRDFSRVIPVAPQRGTIIANVGDIPVALARRIGPGILVFLGSPLGAAIWAGDAEARQWLRSFVSLGVARQT